MRRFRFMMLAVLVLLVQGCASATPPTPVTSLDQLVGKWTGTVTIGRSVTFLWLTIEPDRTLIAIWGSITARGTVTMAGGQASFQMAPPPQEGTITLYTGKGKPQIYMESRDGSFYATVEPQN